MLSAFSVPLITISLETVNFCPLPSASITFIVLFVPIFLSVIILSSVINTASVSIMKALLILLARSCKVLVELKPVITSLPLVYWNKILEPSLVTVSLPAPIAIVEFVLRL